MTQASKQVEEQNLEQLIQVTLTSLQDGEIDLERATIEIVDVVGNHQKELLAKVRELVKKEKLGRSWHANVGDLKNYYDGYNDALNELLDQLTSLENTP